MTVHGPFIHKDIFHKLLGKNYPKINFVSVSKSMAKLFLNPYPSKVIYNGIEVNDFIYKNDPEDRYLWIGRIQPEKGLKEAIAEIKKIREEFWKEVRVTGKADQFNTELEKAGRIADFLEMGELIAIDALNRNESCGAHFREESVELEGNQKGEAKRNDAEYMYVAAWEYTGNEPVLNKEPLSFKAIELKQRNYK